MGDTISIPVVLALLVGVVIGLAAGYITFPAIREAKRLRIRLDELMQEHETYKTTVSAHFRKTGELVGEMTRSYAAVYDHLASGARSFGTAAAAESTLPFGPSPGVLAPPVIETSTASSAPVAPAEATRAAATEPSDAAVTEAGDAAVAGASDAAGIGASDAALDGSMHAAEVFVGNEAALDSLSETTVSAAEPERPAESRKA